jgi:hypothetical protein
VAWLLVAALSSQACGDTTLEPVAPERPARAVAALETAADSEDIVARLQSIPGLTLLDERRAPFPGTRFFRLLFELPADHARPDGERFQLRVNLLHRSVTAPMVLASSGYGLGDFPAQSEPTALLAANQLTLEHRFFGNSRPASNDWTLLSIRQAADDFHRVVEAFKPLYGGRWLNTGGSKGGMAAVYHRYFYPDDVHVTVPYVAPNMHGQNDVRFVHFLEQVGDADCREKMKAFQKDALQRREELLPLFEELVATTGARFDVLGGLDRTLEFAVVEMPFYFWQYGNASLCPFIPAPGAPAREAFSFLDFIVALDFTYGDEALDYFAAFYYQSATEIGWPRYPTQHLNGLLRYPREDVAEAYLTFPVQQRFDQDLMLRVEHWVRDHGERMLFIYGENDPWSAGAFSVRERNDSFRFYVPRANHSTRITRLAEPERGLALERLFTWMGLEAPSASARGMALQRALEAEAEVSEPEERRSRL